MNLARRSFPRSASLLALNEWREKESKNGLQSAVSTSRHGFGGACASQWLWVVSHAMIQATAPA